MLQIFLTRYKKYVKKEKDQRRWKVEQLVLRVFIKAVV